MTEPRPLRVLLVASDGFSAGHVARTLAIARGLGRVAARRRIPLARVLATTSQAHALIAGEPLAVIALPPPVAARQAGLSDAERRRLVGAAIAAVIDGFGPDLIAVDTFPSGPHGELACLAGLDRRIKRALIRRAVPATGEAVTAGLAGYDLAIAAGDPGPLAVELPVPVRHVPPITMIDAGDYLPRAAARAALDLPAGRAFLVAAGGGGDGEAAARAQAIAHAVLRAAPDATVVIALGPLAPDPRAPGAGGRELDAGGPDVPRGTDQRVPGTERVDRAGFAGGPDVPRGTDQRASATRDRDGLGGGPDVPRGTDQRASATRDRDGLGGGPDVPRGTDRIVAFDERLRVVRIAPLAPVLAAFDGAFAAAGYNTAHELAQARVPAALFAQPRPFDDQAARAARFAAAGFACVLADPSDDAVAAALAWMASAHVPALPAGGADRAAEALLDLVVGGGR